AVRNSPGGDTVLVTVTADHKTLAVADAGSVPIRLYEVETGTELRKIDGARAVQGLTALVFSPDGGSLAGRAADGAVVLWDAATGQEVQRISAPAAPNGVRVAPAALRGSSGLAFAPDGKTLAVATTELKQQANAFTIANSLRVWDVATGKE